MYDMNVSRLGLAPQVVEYGPVHRKARGSSGMMGIDLIFTESRQRTDLIHLSAQLSALFGLLHNRDSTQRNEILLVKATITRGASSTLLTEIIGQSSQYFSKLELTCLRNINFSPLSLLEEKDIAHKPTMLSTYLPSPFFKNFVNFHGSEAMQPLYFLIPYS
jgi:hypothetical protein